MRLNKYLALAGVASRRKADELIAAGHIEVNGNVMRELGYDVSEGAKVSVRGRVIEPVSKKMYIALNKPKGYITTTSDERDRPTVMELVADAGAHVFPVGRLDGPTTGLLIFTNDGDFAHHLTHPSHEILKTYRVRVSGVLSKEKLLRLRKGVDIGGYVTKSAKIEIVKQGERTAVVDILISEGKNRQIRKMFGAIGCKVMELERTSVGDVRLGNLKQGHWRKLTRQEIESLYTK